MNAQAITSIAELSDHYDAYLIDLWGVMHDGSTLYAGADAALAHLRAKGKSVIFLSNAPRKAERAIKVLSRLGVDPQHYDHMVTSGQMAHDTLKTHETYGSHYYYLGPTKDEDVLGGLDYEQVKKPDDADFILNAGFEYDYQPEAEIEPLLVRLAALELPLLCINPDLEVVKQDGTRLLCAGRVAGRYEQLGGLVDYIGKPHQAIYHHCLNLLSNMAPSQVLAIGDNLLTDIKGANAMGIDSLLIKGGIMASEHGTVPDGDQLATHYMQTGATPTYVADRFTI